MTTLILPPLKPAHLFAAIALTVLLAFAPVVNAQVFDTPIDIEGSYLTSLDWGDYDGDGDLDLLIAGCVGDMCLSPFTSLYRNDNGTFVDAGVYLKGGGAGAVKFVDVDGDGDLDLFVSGFAGLWGGAHSTVYRNDGASFSTLTTVQGMLGAAVDFGDYDGDGDADMILSGCTSLPDLSGSGSSMNCSTPRTILYDNEGNGTFWAPSTPWLNELAVGSVSFHDIDNDGDLDLLQTGIDATNTPYTYLYENNPEGTFSQVSTSLPAFAAGDIAWSDIDGNGFYDLAISGCTSQNCTTNATSIYLNSGDALGGGTVFSGATAGLPGTAAGSLSFADVNRDGEVDLHITGCSTLDLGGMQCVSPLSILFFGDGTGAFVDSGEVLLGLGLSDALLADFDNNGKIDLAAGGTTSDPDEIWGIEGLIYSGIADGPVPSAFTSVQELDGLYLATMDWGDIDNDGDLDLVVGGCEDEWCQTSVTRLYRNNNGSFVDTNANLDGSGGGIVRFGDIDNDNDLDLFVSGSMGLPMGAHSTIYRNNNGSFVSSQSLRPLLGTAAAFGDYDNDGDLDLVISGCENVDIGLQSCDPAADYLTNDGTGNFNVQFNGADPMALGVGSLAFIDRDNDGDLDLIQTGLDEFGVPTTILYDNALSLALNPISHSLADVAGGGLTVGDYDNDGLLDVALNGCLDDDCSTQGTFLYTNASGSFVPNPQPIATSAGGSLSFGDYDNNGTLDLLQTGCMTLDLAKTDCWGPATSIYSGDGAGNFADALETLTGVGIGEGFFADYDRDGKLDIALVGSTSDPNAIDGRHLEIYHGHAATVNTRPGMPPAPLVSIVDDTAQFDFFRGSDDFTVGLAQSIGLRVGTYSGGSDIVSAAALSGGIRLTADLGNVQASDDNYTLLGLAPGTYYAAYQTVDGNYRGSGFSREVTFQIKRDAPVVDLELTKSVKPGDETPSIGEEVTFEISVSNSTDEGPVETAYGVIVDDILPAELVYVDYSATTGPGITFNSDAHTWTIDQIEAGETVLLSLTAKVEPWASGEIVNCAEVWDFDGHDYITDRGSKPGAVAGGAYHPVDNPASAEDDQDCATIWVNVAPVEKADLSLTKTVSNNQPQVGDEIVFEVVVANSGASTDGVRIEDIVSDDYGCFDFSLTGVGVTRGILTPGSNGKLTWTVDVASGAYEKLSITGWVRCSTPFTNRAEIISSGSVADASQGNDWASVTVVPKEDKTAIDLELTKSVSPQEAQVGDIVTFSIEVTNSSDYGPVTPATNIIVKDHLPAGLSYVWDTATSPSDDARIVSVNQNALVWTISKLAEDEWITLTFQAEVTNYGSLTNVAEIWDVNQVGLDHDSKTGVEGGAYDAQSNPASAEDDQDDATVWVPEPSAKKADLSLSKTVSDATPKVGDDITFTVTVHNAGAATNQVVIADHLTDGYGCFDFSVSNIQVSSGTIGVSWDGSYMWAVDMASYGTETFTITGWVRCESSFENAAEIVSSGSLQDSSQGNDWASVTVDPKGDTTPTTPALCYLVADNDVEGGYSNDVLTVLHDGATIDVKVAHTGTQMIESIAFNPWNRKLYAADARSLGILDVNSGAYAVIGEFGSGWGFDEYGQAKDRGFTDVDGLSFDPFGSVLYGTVRKTGEADLLIKIDPATGKAITNAFGYNQDYVTIKGVYGLTDIDDIAISPWDGTLYAINNRDGRHSRLVVIDKVTGVAAKVLDLPIGNVEGLAFYGDGTLYGTAGEGDEAIVVIDLNTNTARIEARIGAGGRDYESIDCLTNEPNYARVTVFGDANGDGTMQIGEAASSGVPVTFYRDVNGDAQIDAGDLAVAEAITGTDGSVVFEPAATGTFLAQATEFSVASAVFEGFGQEAMDFTLAVAAATSTANEGFGDLPAEFALEGNYPNPFNPQTTIGFSVPEASHVSVTVHNLLGRQMAVLVDGSRAAGRHEVTFDASNMPSGVYLVRMVTESATFTHSMTLIK